MGCFGGVSHHDEHERRTLSRRECSMTLERRKEQRPIERVGTKRAPEPAECRDGYLEEPRGDLPRLDGAHVTPVEARATLALRVRETWHRRAVDAEAGGSDDT